MNDINILWYLIEKGKKGENIGLSVKLPKLEKLIGGIQLNRYYCISAASGIGKTAFILYIIYRLLKDYPDKPIYLLYFSLEIGSEILLSKLMSLYCAEVFGIYLTTNNILSFDMQLGDHEYNCLKEAKKWLEGIQDRIIIIDKGLSASVLYSRTKRVFESLGKVEEVENKFRFFPNNPDLKVFGVIDHMSLIQPKEGRTLKAEMDLTSSYMVTLKRIYPLSWFALMQQNRDSSSMERRKAEMNEPGINDLKDSGSIAQDSDCVLQIFSPMREKLPTYRDYKILGPKSLGSRFRSIILSKNRYGIADKVIGTAFYGEVS